MGSILQGDNIFYVPRSRGPQPEVDSMLRRMTMASMCTFLLFPVFMLFPGCGDDDGGPPAVQGPRIVFNSRRVDPVQLFHMKLNGTDVHQITSGAGTTFGALSGDGRKVAYESSPSGQQNIYIANLDGSGEVQLTDSPSQNYRPVFYPAGTHIAFVSDRAGGDRDIWLMNVDGTGLVQLTTTPGEDTFPAFSHDGQRVLFTSNRGATSQIYAVNLDGTGEVNLSNNAYNDYTPCAAPDGSKILFSSDRDGDADLYVMDLDGSNQTQLLDIAGGEYHASYTPDGQRVVFYSDVSGNWEIYIVGVDGSNLMNLTNNPADDFKTCTLIAP
jgi:Tol biopolymer transport system component